ncbi:sigma-70 family RNA polymerase sigma factor [Streptomyces dioscori]|uniref:Sigma-70 family RNA polymerase sigma factor n=1 Tax=Streptomyces dioscori TaxID=2109333 RepID=A0A2P8PYH3_9ACTN|nr:sigma-70 family RNA polymerase sigma factor [Streptomyces dioscori]PSM39043.1 sigma-70 family RNA polymerase sigma factor [Streptomyces dioscori]
MRLSRTDGPPDADLVHAAQAGDVSALGTLLARHRPMLLSAAIGLLGYGPDAEDAVQEASMIALRRIGGLRDPEAVSSWLRAVVRNVCRMHYRAPVHLSMDDGLAASLRSAESDPQELLEGQATRDWVWHALETLSSPLRLVMMLRYFSGVTAYQDIAVACGVPVGTVRSRLSEARDKLTRALLATADTAHGDIRTVTMERVRQAEELLEAARRGESRSALGATWLPTVALSGAGGLRAEGYDALARGLEQDVADGVRHRLTNVVAGRDLAVWEFTLKSPPEDPLHCPPGGAWVLHLRSGWVERARLFHTRRAGDSRDRPLRRDP